MSDYAEFLDTFCDRWKPLEHRQRSYDPPRVYNDLAIRDPTDNPDSLDEFCQAVVDLIEHWIRIHTTASGYFRYTIEDMVYHWENCHARDRYTHKKSDTWGMLVFGGGDLCTTFDWHTSTFRRWIETQLIFYKRCLTCTGIVHIFDTCGCDKEETDESSSEVSFDELYDFLEGIDVEYDLDTCAEDALLKEGFDLYFDSMEPCFRNFLQEMLDVLGQIVDSTSPADLLTAVLMATHLRHVGGRLLDDYADEIGLNVDWLNMIQQEGIVSAFTQECIETWLERPLRLLTSAYFESRELL